MPKNKVVDFTWDLREAIRDSEVQAREDVCNALNRNLVGCKVRIHSYTRSGMQAQPVLVELVCHVESIDVGSEGYNITVTTDKGNRIVPHPPLGIEVLPNEPEDLHI